jgi:hypothetical protein
MSKKQEPKLARVGGKIALALGLPERVSPAQHAVVRLVSFAQALLNPPEGPAFDAIVEQGRAALAGMSDPTQDEARAVILGAGGMIGPYGAVVPLPLPMACFGKVGKAGEALGFSRVDGNLSDMMRSGLGSVLVLTNNESAPKWMEQLRRGARSADLVRAYGGAPDAPSDGSPEEQDGC